MNSNEAKAVVTEILEGGIMRRRAECGCRVYDGELRYCDPHWSLAEALPALAAHAAVVGAVRSPDGIEDLLELTSWRSRQSRSKVAEAMDVLAAHFASAGHPGLQEVLKRASAALLSL
ncbi:MAG: hypothetical protein IPQ24_11340 [Anaeromyxobacter sp.]|nr:hypothetical protein [Anaeromyxobacter sp.]